MAMYNGDIDLESLVRSFMENLKKFRTDRGLSQIHLAELINVTPRVYNRWERGSATPRLDTLVKLADILQVSLDELAGREAHREEEPRIKNPKLHGLYKEIDKLSLEDQHALIILLDSLIKRSKINRVLAG